MTLPEMKEERYTCFPSLAFWSLAIVARTVAACSPPITDMRAFGHIYKNLGLKKCILNIKERHCHISWWRIFIQLRIHFYVWQFYKIVFFKRYINILQCLQHYIWKCKNFIHFYYSSFLKNFSFLDVFSSYSQPTGNFLLNIPTNFNSMGNLEKLNLKKQISHVQSAIKNL